MFIPGFSMERITQINQGTAAAHVGIEFTEIGPDYLVARMPVDARTRQPAGLLHGGASVLLAETLGSVAAYGTLPEGKACVGLEINANHLRSVREGWVYGRAAPLHVGRTTQVWEIRITDEADRLVCVSRITMAVIDVR
jgi:1,4-dihydroxy-2-naphthoyl-CoA hydrolase